MTDIMRRHVKREDLPEWAKHAPSGSGIVLMPKGFSCQFLDDEISIEEYTRIVEECEIVIVE